MLWHASHFKTFSNVEQLFLKACEGQNCEEEPILYVDFFFPFQQRRQSCSQSVSGHNQLFSEDDKNESFIFMAKISKGYRRLINLIWRRNPRHSCAGTDFDYLQTLTSLEVETYIIKKGAGCISAQTELCPSINLTVGL